MEILIERINPGSGSSCGNSDSQEPEDHNPIEASPPYSDDPVCKPIKVLAIYTEAASREVPDIIGIIETCMGLTKQAYLNSDIKGTSVSLDLVEIMKLLEYTSDPSSAMDITKLLGNEEVIAAKKRTKADIVVVFTGLGKDKSYDNNTTAGRAGTLTLDPTRALSVIIASRPFVGFVNTHEISHLFGCRHDREFDDAGPIEHAWNFRFGWWRSPFSQRATRSRITVMWHEWLAQNVNHLSNPDVNYRGTATGTSSDNNALKIKQTACEVAMFVDEDDTPPQVASVQISGEFSACSCTETWLEAILTNQPAGALTFAWQTSFDGINYGSILGADSNYLIALPCGDPFSAIFVRLTVTNGAGQIMVATHRIRSRGNGGVGGICPRSFHESTPTSSSKSSLLFPNPVSSTLNINARLNSLFSPAIYDILGKRIIGLPMWILNNGNWQIDVSNLPDGIYILKLPDGSEANTFVKIS